MDNILIAEDDEDDYNCFTEAFLKISSLYEITRAKNGSECINILRSHSKPDIIFLDLNMPFKNGLGCLKIIKSNNRFSNIPVIIYSTSHYIKDIDACYKNEAHYFIGKPTDTKFLADILAKVITRISESPGRSSKENFVVRIASTINY